MELDLIKLKDTIQNLINNPLNKNGRLEWQIGDILIDINSMLEKKELKPIYVYETASETETWRREFRESSNGMNQLPLAIIFPYQWVKGLNKENNKEVA